MARPSLTFVVDPRFPGGTTAALAHEMEALDGLARMEVAAISSGMFPGRPVSGVLAETLDARRVSLGWDPSRVAADTVVLHNPSFLKFDDEFRPKIVARDLVVVTHENLLRPGGIEAFDVARCLGLIDRASLAVRKWLAPVSRWNRTTVEDWLAGHPGFAHWSVLAEDWHNICDLPLSPPTSRPADRRGRHSRPGFEKFPSLTVLDTCFPPYATANVILGADTLMTEAAPRPHWQLFPFQGIEIDRYFSMIDFMIYFTAPTLRESFGRVLAESIAAGKVVISDPETASTFGDGVIGARPDEVDGIIARFVADPALYARQVERAQAELARFSAEAFRAKHGRFFGQPGRAAA